MDQVSSTIRINRSPSLKCGQKTGLSTLCYSNFQNGSSDSFLESEVIPSSNASIPLGGANWKYWNCRGSRKYPVNEGGDEGACVNAAISASSAEVSGTNQLGNGRQVDLGMRSIFDEGWSSLIPALGIENPPAIQHAETLLR
jgi:hypothetical protein